MWPDLPIEFNVHGTPVSFQSENKRAKQGWKKKVLTAALASVRLGSWAFDDLRLAVTLYYFPQVSMPGDVDNIVKLTLDAMVPNIYLNDWLIDRVLVQRFDPSITATFAEPTEVLLDAMAADEPVLYVRISEAPVEDLGL